MPLLRQNINMLTSELLVSLDFSNSARSLSHEHSAGGDAEGKADSERKRWAARRMNGWFLNLYLAGIEYYRAKRI